MKCIVETSHLFKCYQKKAAVCDVSLRIRRGDIYGLIGNNGAGKTTLMKLLLGLVQPTGGSFSLFGEEDGARHRIKIGSLIEAPALYGDCSAYENMRRFALLYGTDMEEGAALLSFVGLSSVQHKRVSGFSLGMRQRLGIAIALLSHPELLILDEPNTGLDPQGIRDLRDLLLRLNREFGVTILLSSHLLDELAKVVTVYGIMRDGELVEQVTREALQTACAPHLRLVTEDNERACELIRARYEDAALSLMGGALHLSNHLDEAINICGYLAENKLPVREMAQSESSVEDYFIERMKRV